MATPAHIPGPEESAAAEEFSAAPRTETERRLARMWAEVLQLSRVGVEQNFFDLGGHSLLVHVVHERIVSEVGLNPPLVDLFRYPTVRTLARYLDTSSDPVGAAGPEAPARTSGQPAARRTNRPAQRRRAQLDRRRHEAGGGENA